MATRTFRRTHRWAALTAAGALTLAGCGAGGSSDSAAPTREASEAQSASAGTGASTAAGEGASDGDVSGAASKGAQQAPTGTHVARTASLSITVEDVERASAGVRSAADRAGGYVSAEESRSAPEGQDHEASGGPATGRAAASDIAPPERGGSWAEITVTVPVAELDPTLMKLSEIGEVTQRGSDAEDLSSQYTDTAARVRTKKKSIQRLQRLISDTEDLGQIVSLEGELAQREADLESMTSQQKSLEQRSTTAPITVSLSSPEVAADRDSPDESGFVAGLGHGWGAFTSALAVGLTVLGAVTPFVVAGFLLLAPIMWWLRRSRRRVASAPAAPVDP